MHPRRTRFATSVVAVGLGLGTALVGASPAHADVTPTLTGPASVDGFSYVTLTGIAEPRARVRLREAAFLFRTDMYYAPAFADTCTAADLLRPNAECAIVETTADANGRYTLRRRMDSGFTFVAEADTCGTGPVTADCQVRSGMLDVSNVAMVRSGGLRVSTSATTVTFGGASEPGQEHMTVEVQRLNGSAWVKVAEGATLPAAGCSASGECTTPGGSFAVTATGQSGLQTYRVAILGDPANRVLLGYSDQVRLTVGSSAEPAFIPRTPTSPGTSTPTTPTTPTKPTTPTAPVVVQPKVGDLKFTLAQYNPPGADTPSKLNKEFVRITNTSTRSWNLKNWTITDRAGNKYRFTTDFVLARGKYTYVLTGRGTNGRPVSTYRYWGKTGFIWNNTGDAAYLRTNTGRLIDSCAWGNGKGSTFC